MLFFPCTVEKKIYIFFNCLSKVLAGVMVCCIVSNGYPLCALTYICSYVHMLHEYDMYFEWYVNIYVVMSYA